ncbi:SCO family protein [Marinobacter halodurans]|uniref:SCO family protein n=1 Tax=Marinobacter halodurans TaxID=2528979 RepID=A0ABY1ZKF1_9GAMM|nr:SCO family protein [Marinobacter halodurans]TBW56001.1 SCO family protein [Marinobacter halodurans]
MSTYRRTTTALLLASSVLALLMGCSDGKRHWNGKDISGVMPDLAFTLRDVDGQTVQPDDTAGQVRVLFFGYTSCPDVCPTTLAYLHKVIEKMPADTRDDITALFVSVDPRRDTPERLGRYVAHFDSHIVGLTGPEDALRELAKRYRTTFGYGDPDSDGNYAVSHSSAIYVFDGKGRIRLLLKQDMPQQQAADDLAQLVRQDLS